MSQQLVRHCSVLTLRCGGGRLAGVFLSYGQDGVALPTEGSFAVLKAYIDRSAPERWLRLSLWNFV
eukprot:6439894-Alexandrium_andersonii.AAC.1